jgi:hypothetical protein
MANTFISTSIATGLVIEAAHVTQSADAFTGTEAYDITISGSLDINNAPITNLTASGNISASGDITGNTGSFQHINLPQGAAIKSLPGGNVEIISEDGAFLQITDSFIFDNNGATFAVNAQGDVSDIRHITASGNISASGDIFGDRIYSNNIQVVRHVSNTTFLGKTGVSTNILGSITASIISASGDIIGATFGDSSGNIIFSGNVSGSGTNSSYFGDEYNAHGGDANSGFTLLSLGAKPSIHASGASLVIGNTTNSTQTGIDLIGEVTASGNISSSAIIEAGTIQSNGTSTAKTRIIIDPGTGNGAQLEMSSAGNLAIATDEGGTLTSTTFLSNNVIASNNISASGEMGADSLRVENRASGVTADVIISGSTFDGDSRDAQIIYPNHGLHFNSDNGTHNHVLALASNGVGIRRQPADANNALEVSGSIQVIDGDIFGATNITASGHGLFQAGKPIITHTSSPISSSLANAGKYHIVGGTLTASIVLDSNAPVGAEYEFFQTSSAGQFLFESASGTTVISKNGSLRLAQQGSSAVLKKVSTTTFHLMGDLT